MLFYSIVPFIVLLKLFQGWNDSTTGSYLSWPTWVQFPESHIFLMLPEVIPSADVVPNLFSLMLFLALQIES